MTAETLRTAPVQDRAARRIEQILQAARNHYAKVGRDRFNTGDVAKMAGCSVGTLYRYFADRVALLDAIDPDRDKARSILEEIAEVDALFFTEGQKWATVRGILVKNGLVSE